jgi:hypothetical protein
MTLSKPARNRARLAIIITSISVFSISSAFAAASNYSNGSIFCGVSLTLLAIFGLVILAVIFIELHNINTRLKMRRFMLLFDTVDRFINEGKTQEEIMAYLTQIQKLKKKEARDFLAFISDPTNHQFLADVNAEIHAAKLLKNAE